MRVTSIFIFILWFVTGAAEAQQLSRAEAVAEALAANPQVKLSLEQVAFLEGNITEAKADALPDLSWRTIALRARDPSLLNSPNFDEFPPEFREALEPRPANAFSTAAVVKQTIYSFKLGKALEAAKLARTAGQEDVQRARQRTALDAVRAYNQLLFTMEQLRVIRANVDSKQSHLDDARNRRAAGAATELEVLRSEVDLENQRAEQFRAESEVASARATLNTVIVRPTNTPIEPTDTLAVVPFSADFEDAVKEALLARPELRTLRLQEEIQDKLVDVAAAEAKPTFDFDASLGFAVRRPRNFLKWNYSSWSAAFTAKVPLFDGYRTAGKVAKAKAQKNTATQQIAALENQVRLEVQSAWDALALAERTTKAADLNVTQARRAADMTEANYRLGAATQLEVVDALQVLRQAENIRNQSLYLHANGQAALKYVMGRDPLK
jgi:HAE1 family hydrophobic/amphiphilic exporter-1